MAAKKLNGSWELIHVKYYDNEGIMHLPTCSGEFKAEKTSDTELNYEQNISFTLLGTPIIDQHFGTIHFFEKASKMELAVNTVDTSYIQQLNIILLNKTDFKVEFFDLNGNKRLYTFRKN